MVTSLCNQYLIMAVSHRAFIHASQFRLRSSPVHSLFRLSMASYSSFVKDKAFVNGKWVGAASGKTFEVTNPYDGSKIVSVPDMAEEDVKVAIKAAHKAFDDWRFTTGKERSDLMKRWFDILSKDASGLADLITTENGKPMADSTGEVAYGNGFIDWYAGEARRIKGDVIASPVKSKRMMVIRQPIGPVGIITPWNFPYAMITRKLGAALAAGCTVVVKPAEDTPLSALALAQASKEAGIPDGVINVVTSSRQNAAEVGRTLCESEALLSISFTGSTAVGRELSRLSAPTVKRMSLELGGHAPLIVFESANIEKAVEGIMASKFRCSGQTCVCSNRIFVHEKVHDRLVEALTKAVATLKVGNGKAEGVNQGPLINAAAVEKSERHVENAKSLGAKVVVGGSRLDGNCFEPTVLTNVSPDMLCCQEETFGPLVPVVKFRDEAEVLKIANSLPVGLAGYFYSEDLSQIWRVAERLEVGLIGVNEGMISGVEIPFGGVKQSGIGREGGIYGIDEYLEFKYICMGNI